jgi:hypothetical protein
LDPSPGRVKFFAKFQQRLKRAGNFGLKAEILLPSTVPERLRLGICWNSLLERPQDRPHRLEDRRSDATINRTDKKVRAMQSSFDEDVFEPDDADHAPLAQSSEAI